MKKLLTLAAAGCLAAVPSVGAGDRGTTVCVFRNRPAAINPVPRAQPRINSMQRGYNNRAGNHSSYGSNGGWNGGWYYGNTGWKVPVIYGWSNPRLHYVSPFIPNGYVGGLRNLPTNVVQIPPMFGKTGFYGHHGFPRIGGYIGGLANLPTPVVQIPPTFGKPAFIGGSNFGPGYGGGHGHGHGGGGHGGGGHGGGGHGGGGRGR